MNALQLLSGPLADAIGWALLHLVWQAVLVAGILAGVLGLLSRASANARYVAACSALALLFTLFIATAVRSYDPRPVVTAAPSTAPQTITISLREIPVLVAKSAAIGARERLLEALSAARPAFPAVVAIWLAGVIVLSLRLIVSWARARRWMLLATTPADPSWAKLGAQLSEALSLTRTVRLLQSAASEVPFVIGYLRPVIILPASTLTGMTPQQVEMVLAHEFAHIRRHDFAVNLLQAVVETLMFYHPAVWWMSHRVRVERENCCDDLAVSICGNPVQYARALARLEELRDSAPSVAMAANGGRLLDRIRRIGVLSSEGTGSTSRWIAGAVMMLVFAIGIAVPSVTAAQRKAPKPPAPPAAPAALPAPHATVDVVAPAPAPPAPEPAPEEVVLPLVEAPEAAPEPPAVPDPGPFQPFVPFAAGATVAPVPLVNPLAGTPVAPVAPVTPVIAVEPISGIPVPALAPVPPRTPVPPRPAVTPRPLPHDAPYAIAAGTPAPTPRASKQRAPKAKASKHADREDEDDSDDDGDEGDDDLIAARAVGATPEYIASMRQLFRDLSLSEAIALKAVGVTHDFVLEMRAAGVDASDAEDVTALRAVGVTPEYIRAMRAAGLQGDLDDEIVGLKAVGVTPEYLQQIRAAGLAVADPDDATALRAVGVSAEWLREIRATGVAITDADDATSLRALGVTAALVKRLQASGHANLTVDELEDIAASGLDERFFDDVQRYRKK